MVDENDAGTGSTTEVPQPAKQVSVQMQWGENGNQPIYSNFSTANAGHDVIVIDFGFVEPSAINAMNRAIKSGEATPEALNARQSRKITLNAETAQQLSQQLNQLLRSGSPTAPPAPAKNPVNDSETNKTADSVSEKSDEQVDRKSNGSGFRFPWSKKK